VKGIVVDVEVAVEEEEEGDEKTEEAIDVAEVEADALFNGFRTWLKADT
jgi:hypothetical protein